MKSGDCCFINTVKRTILVGLQELYLSGGQNCCHSHFPFETHQKGCSYKNTAKLQRLGFLLSLRISRAENNSSVLL